MAVNWTAPAGDTLLPVPGLRLGVSAAGIRKPGRKDVTVMLLDEGCQVAGVFTQNRYCAAPVQLCRDHLITGPGVRALVVNTGCANAGTGAQGMADAKQTCEALAALLGVQPDQVLPFSTGVIMENLPMPRLLAGLAPAVADASADNWLATAEAIMTTDTLPKGASQQADLAGHRVTVTGIAKGAGMIRPNMATMLGFVATDAAVAADLMPELVRRLADASFNRITVDGDTSTNDSFVLIATGRSGAPVVDSLDSTEGRALWTALLQVAQTLAHAIVRDGEGATKFIEVCVGGGRSAQECLKVAYAIAHSPLVKTAFFASDPNLGRILAAVGYAGISDLDQGLIELHLDDVHVVTCGGRHPAYREEDGARVMAQAEIKVRVGLGRGEAMERVWTCDFSHDYVTINADYRS